MPKITIDGEGGLWLRTKRRRRLMPYWLAAIAVAFGLGQAQAADLGRGSIKDSSSPVYTAPGTGWTGPWIGVVGGYTFADTQVDLNTTGESAGHNLFHVDGLASQGFFGEIQGGYDYMLNQRLVLGLFGGVNLNNAKFEASVYDGAAGLSATQNWGAVVGPRLGVLLTPDSMLYAGGGMAWTNMDDVKGTGELSGFSLSSDTQQGWFGELGLESKVSQSTFVKVFGRYNEFGSFGLSTDKGEIPGLSLDTSTLVIGAGLVYKIN